MLLAQVQQRDYHPMWLPKHRDIYKPSYYDNVIRRWDYLKTNNRRVRTQDPLFFDHDMTYVNGGIQLLITQTHGRANYAI